MEAWQIDLYHRNTEDGGIHIQRNAAAVTNKSNDRFNLRDRDKVKLTSGLECAVGQRILCKIELKTVPK